MSKDELLTLQHAIERLELSEDQIKQAMAESVVQVGDCIEWQRGLCGRGYGRLENRVGGERRKFSAHRLAYLLHNGPIPGALCVLHICDNRRCVNPNHLVVGSHTANMQDMKRKGRSMSGAASPRSKLTTDEAGLIRTLGRLGTPHQEIADQFGVSRPTVTKIINGTAYRVEMA